MSDRIIKFEVRNHPNLENNARIPVSIVEDGIAFRTSDGLQDLLRFSLGIRLGWGIKQHFPHELGDVIAPASL